MVSMEDMMLRSQIPTKGLTKTPTTPSTPNTSTLLHKLHLHFTWTILHYISLHHEARSVFCQDEALHLAKINVHNCIKVFLESIKESSVETSFLPSWEHYHKTLEWYSPQVFPKYLSFVLPFASTFLIFHQSLTFRKFPPALCQLSFPFAWRR